MMQSIAMAYLKHLLSTLTLQDILVGLSAIATSAYTIITYYTLRAIKKQTTLSHRPHLVIAESTFSLFTRPQNGKHVPVEITYAKEQTAPALPFLNGFYIKVFNVGMAAAVNLEFEYTFDIKKALKLAESLNNMLSADERVVLFIEKDFIILKGGTNTPYTELGIGTTPGPVRLDHLLPVSMDKEPAAIHLPQCWVHLFAVIFYLQRQTNQYALDSFPLLGLTVRHQGINDEKWSVEFSMGHEFRMAGDSFYNAKWIIERTDNH